MDAGQSRKIFRHAAPGRPELPWYQPKVPAGAHNIAIDTRGPYYFFPNNSPHSREFLSTRGVYTAGSEHAKEDQKNTAVGADGPDYSLLFTIVNYSADPSSIEHVPDFHGP